MAVYSVILNEDESSSSVVLDVAADDNSGDVIGVTGEDAVVFGVLAMIVVFAAVVRLVTKSEKVAGTDGVPSPLQINPVSRKKPP